MAFIDRGVLVPQFGIASTEFLPCRGYPLPYDASRLGTAPNANATAMLLMASRHRRYIFSFEKRSGSDED